MFLNSVGTTASAATQRANPPASQHANPLPRRVSNLYPADASHPKVSGAITSDDEGIFMPSPPVSRRNSISSDVSSASDSNRLTQRPQLLRQNVLDSRPRAPGPSPGHLRNVEQTLSPLIAAFGDMEPAVQQALAVRHGTPLAVNDLYRDEQIDASLRRRDTCTRQVLQGMNVASADIDRILAHGDGLRGSEAIIDACRVLSMPEAQRDDCKVQISKLRDALASYLKKARKAGNDYTTRYIAFGADACDAGHKLLERVSDACYRIGVEPIRQRLQADLAPAMLHIMSNKNPGICAGELRNMLPQLLNTQAFNVYKMFQQSRNPVDLLHTSEMLPNLLDSLATDRPPPGQHPATPSTTPATPAHPFTGVPTDDLVRIIDAIGRMFPNITNTNTNTHTPDIRTYNGQRQNNGGSAERPEAVGRANEVDDVRADESERGLPLYTPATRRPSSILPAQNLQATGETDNESEDEPFGLRDVEAREDPILGGHAGTATRTRVTQPYIPDVDYSDSEDDGEDISPTHHADGNARRRTESPWNAPPFVRVPLTGNSSSRPEERIPDAERRPVTRLESRPDVALRVPVLPDPLTLKVPEFKPLPGQFVGSALLFDNSGLAKERRPGSRDGFTMNHENFRQNVRIPATPEPFSTKPGTIDAGTHVARKLDSLEFRKAFNLDAPRDEATLVKVQAEQEQRFEHTHRGIGAVAGEVTIIRTPKESMGGDSPTPVWSRQNSGDS